MEGWKLLAAENGQRAPPFQRRDLTQCDATPHLAAPRHALERARHESAAARAGALRVSNPMHTMHGHGLASPSLRCVPFMSPSFAVVVIGVHERPISLSRVLVVCIW